MASTGTKLFLGLGCALMLSVVFALYTCASFMKSAATSAASSPVETDPIGFEARTNAWFACKKAVLERLKAPGSAEFIDEDHGYKRVFLDESKLKSRKEKKAQESMKKLGVKRLLVQGEVDAQNSFGAKLRSSFDCSFLEMSDGRVVLTGTRIDNRR
jgi:hypothetical protein